MIRIVICDDQEEDRNEAGILVRESARKERVEIRLDFVENGTALLEYLGEREADLILLEGFKHTGWPKLEVVRKGNSEEPVSDPATLLALVTDLPLEVPGVPVLPLDQPHEAVRFLLRLVKEDGGHA